MDLLLPLSATERVSIGAGNTVLSAGVEITAMALVDGSEEILSLSSLKEGDIIEGSKQPHRQFRVMKTTLFYILIQSTNGTGEIITYYLGGNENTDTLRALKYDTTGDKPDYQDVLTLGKLKRIPIPKGLPLEGGGSINETGENKEGEVDIYLDINRPSLGKIDISKLTVGKSCITISILTSENYSEIIRLTYVGQSLITKLPKFRGDDGIYYSWNGVASNALEARPDFRQKIDASLYGQKYTRTLTITDTSY